ncbi:MAG TPA: helix-turn-helix domain-containing protein [Verrucomicrobiota bacterium]|nr:helix-turn-helix domain-containing protein [Verrucomicrobiota bacterium]OQC26013.1 MAG: Helix-turn-helix domain protein [Verrucomicrobia bacterium ADurb.Bin063]HNW08031.1 helix-turn-helix domain-containing protein [Verrucomicrobiota bacterium]HNZ76198.1 helix-turn-helix domain-containing protein [Verrucomicrobiota bacterium]HOH39218.1 helix-turn-helix domain-containing protein [Verrucomicrobiota bacterium]
MKDPNTQTHNPNDRLMRFLQATPEQQAAIDRILEGRLAPQPPAPEPPKGPLLMMIKDAAVLLGVHRATIWRLLRAGRLEPVMLLGAVRVRRADVEGIAAGHQPADARKPKAEGRSPKASKEVAR